MNRILIILFIISSNVIQSQEPEAGLIMPNKKFRLCCVYIPSSGLKIYDKPNGKVQGQIRLGKADNNNEFYKAIIEKNGLKKELKHSNLEMVGYEIMALIFLESKSGFVKLNNGYWVNSEELKSKNLRLISWMDYAIEKNTEWYADDLGLNLRKGPSTNFKKIITLKGNLFGIKLTKEKKGKWNKVKVTKYRKHPCSGKEDIIIKKYTGWIKVISEEKTLNIWNYAKGC